MNGRWCKYAGAAVILAAACSNVGSPPAPGEGDEAYYPNGDGSRWTYRYQRYFNNVPAGEPFNYTETFRGAVNTGGTTAQRLKRHVEGADYYVIAFIADDDAAVVSDYGREFYKGGRMAAGAYFDPPWATLVYPLAVNRTWSVVKGEGFDPLALGLSTDVDNDSQPDTVDVEIVRTVVTREDLTLPMGNFPDCYKIRETIYAGFHMSSGGGVDETYVRYAWFKPGKGFVQYTGDEIGVPNGARYAFLAQLTEYEPSKKAPPVP